VAAAPADLRKTYMSICSVFALGSVRIIHLISSDLIISCQLSGWCASAPQSDPVRRTWLRPIRRSELLVLIGRSHGELDRFTDENEVIIVIIIINIFNVA